jgi:hypothetical protein
MISNSNENMLMDDANAPEANRKLLGVVSSDFVKVSDQLKEASYQIRQRGFSGFPIFVTAKRPVELGILLLEAQQFENDFEYRATFLDEFVQRGLIAEEAIEAFKENYKNPDEYCCLFVIESDFAGFIHIPFPED